MSEKLQKVMARCGLGSRRGLEKWIEDGRVSINGSVSSLGDRIKKDDVLRVDGRVVPFETEEESQRRVMLYHKPEGEICSRHDPEGRPSVFDQLPKLTQQRWILVGRLDINSSGLLLLTTDGELANRLMHPSSEIEREYAVRVNGEFTDEMAKAMREGVMLEDGISRFNKIEDAGGTGFNHWYHVTLKQGKYREVRRLWESQGLTVSRLIRIRFGTIEMPSSLKSGRWVDLERKEIDKLAATVDLESKKYTGLYGRAKVKSERQDNKFRARRGHLRRRHS